MLFDCPIPNILKRSCKLPRVTLSQVKASLKSLRQLAFIASSVSNNGTSSDNDYDEKYTHYWGLGWSISNSIEQMH